MNTTENEKLHQLNTMVLTDSPPSKETLPVYLFTETPDNQESVLKRGAELFHAGKASYLLLIDNQGGSEPGYPGASPWQNRLLELKVPKETVTLIPFKEPLLHTISEAFTMAHLAKEKGWSKIIIIAPPFHLSRCFLSAITAVRFHNTGLRVYNQVGVAQPWYENAIHSQKAVRGLRKDLIVEELRRIKRYQRRNKLLRLITDGFLFLKMIVNSNDPMREIRKIPMYRKYGSPVPLISTNEALEYLKWRDNQ